MGTLQNTVSSFEPVESYSPRPARAPPRWTRFADRIGGTASFLCAIHCALLPFVIAILPLVGLGFLADHAIERGFVVFACLLATTTLGLGFRRHRDASPLFLLLPGIALLASGVLVDFERASTLHAVLVSSGGTLLALAHWRNLRVGHRHDANCRH
jgi:hypothetical protein